MTPEIRKQIWLRGCGAKTLMEDNPGYYQSLKNSCDYPNPCFHQIELDLKRTFPSLSSHCNPEREAQMRGVLSTYIKRNATVGYCQGMNFIVAVLLHYLDEEESFWVLCQIVEYLLPVDYYTIMTGVIIDQRGFEYLLKQRFSKLSKHLHKMGFDCQANIFQWFVCLFSNTFSFDIVSRIWDNIFLHGIVTIFQYGLGVFELMKKSIMKIKDFGEMFELFRGFPSQITDWNVFSAAAEKHKIPQATLKMQRGYFRPTVYEQYEEVNRKKDSDITLRNSIGSIKIKFLNKFFLFIGLMKQRGQGNVSIEDMKNYENEIVQENDCDESWPICLYDFLYKDKHKQHFAFRTQTINVVEDYFGDDQGENAIINSGAANIESILYENSRDQLHNLLLERNEHI